MSENDEIPDYVEGDPRPGSTASGYLNQLRGTQGNISVQDELYPQPNSFDEEILNAHLHESRTESIMEDIQFCNHSILLLLELVKKGRKSTLSELENYISQYNVNENPDQLENLPNINKHFAKQGIVNFLAGGADPNMKIHEVVSQLDMKKNRQMRQLVTERENETKLRTD